MEKQARVREIKMNIENEFVLNLVTYLTQEENYIFVGNENEIWLENLSHPKVQLIHINAQKKMTAMHATYLSHKAEIIPKQIKRKFLMHKIKTLVLNACDFDLIVESNSENYVSIVNVNNAEAAYETLGYIFPTIGNFDLSASMAEIAAKLQSETRKRANNEIHMTESGGLPIINSIFLVLLVAIFAYLWYRNRDLPSGFVAIHYGATYNPLIVAGELWRLVASAFMHLEPMHLIFNAIFIYRFGSMVENVFGKMRMILIILISAITSGLFGFAFSTSFSLGASGVAYGFIGVLVFLGFEMRRTFMPMLKQIIVPILVISTLFSIFVANIDHFGHLGGFVGGFLAATILGVPKIKPFFARTFLTFVTLAVLVSGLWLSGVRLTADNDFDEFNLALISEYNSQGNTERARELIGIFFGDVEVEP